MRRVELDGAPAIEDKQVRAKLATWYAQETSLKYTGYRALSALSRGDTPGPENSIGKLVAASKTQDMASFAMDLMGLSGAIADPAYAEARGMFQTAFRARREAASLGAATRSCSTSSPSACSACPRMCAWTRAFPSTRCPPARPTRVRLA